MNLCYSLEMQWSSPRTGHEALTLPDVIQYLRLFYLSFIRSGSEVFFKKSIHLTTKQGQIVGSMNRLFDLASPSPSNLRKRDTLRKQLILTISPQSCPSYVVKAPYDR